MKTVIAIVMAACIGLSYACVKEANHSSAESGDVLGEESVRKESETTSLEEIGWGVPEDEEVELVDKQVGGEFVDGEYIERKHYLIVDKHASVLLLDDWRAREEGNRVVTGPFPLREEDIRVEYEFMGKAGFDALNLEYPIHKWYDLSIVTRGYLLCLYSTEERSEMVCAVFGRKHECMVVRFRGCSEEEKWDFLLGASY